MGSPAFEVMISLGGAVGLWILKDAVNQLRALRESVAELNSKIAVVVSRIDTHENRLNRLEENS
jgi:hypothetical protein